MGFGFILAFGFCHLNLNYDLDKERNITIKATSDHKFLVKNNIIDWNKKEWKHLYELNINDKFIFSAFLCDLCGLCGE